MSRRSLDGKGTTPLVGARLPRSQREALDRLAEQRGISVAAAVRYAIGREIELCNAGDDHDQS